MRLRLGTALTIGTLLAGGLAALPVEAAKPPSQRVYRDAGDAPPRVDVVEVRVGYAGIWEPDPHGVTVERSAPFRRGDRVTVWVDIDGDLRPEGRIDHVVGERLTIRRANGWGRRGAVLPRWRCTEETEHPYLSGGRRLWGLSFHAWCFDGPNGVSGKTWRVSVTVVSGGLRDGAPGRGQWIPRLHNVP